MLPATGRGQHFQARGYSFSLYGQTLSRQITFLFLSRRKLANKLVCLHNFISNYFGLKLCGERTTGLNNQTNSRN